MIAWVLTLAVFAPGYAMYDTLAQFAQATNGQYDDWHPPAMARLWSLLAPATTGTWPLFALQVTGWWLGLALIATALAQARRPHAGAAVIAVGLIPPLLGWQVVVLKDALLVAATLAGAALVVAPRLTGTAVARWRWVLAGLLWSYAALVRANAIFAIAPLVAMLLPLAWRWRIAVATGLIGATLALAPIVNHRLLVAQPSGVERTQAIYDLAGIAVRAPEASVGLPARAIAHIAARRCVRPFFWDPLGDAAHCAADVAAWHAMPASRLYGRLARTIVAHPAAYLAQRLSHLNSTERWLVPIGWPGAAPPLLDEPNAVGLRGPGSVAAGWQRFAGWMVETPLGWPWAYAAVALAMLVAFGRDPHPAAVAARALLVSALALEASFAVVSIASDLRYHLWPMTATLLAFAIGQPRFPRRACLWGGIALAVLAAPALWARVALPRVAPSYAAMLG